MSRVRPTRRTILAGSTAAAALVRAAAAGRLQTAEDEPLFRISLAEWSLHRAINAKELDPLDFPTVAAREYGVDAVEYVSTFYRGRAADFDYLERLRENARAAAVKSVLIMIDGEGDLAAEDDEARRTAVEKHFKWVAAARFLGCHAIRVNVSGSGAPDAQLAHAADSLRRLAEVARDYGIAVIVENHGGLSSNGAWLAEVMRRADHAGVGTLPDFGNFHLGDGVSYDRYQGVTELMPFARGVSAKSHEFDAEGNEVRTDYRRMLRIVVAAGYRGYLGIEYEGEADPEPIGIQKTKALLERVRAEIAAEKR